MNIKIKSDSFRPGVPRHIILQLLRIEENEWKCKQIPPNKKTKTRKIIFTKDESWRFYDE